MPQKWLQNLLKVTKISCLLVDWFLALHLAQNLVVTLAKKCERLGGNIQFCYLFWQLGGLGSDSYTPTLFSALRQPEQSLLPFSHAKHQRPLHVCSHVFVHVTIPAVPSVLKINPFSNGINLSAYLIRHSVHPFWWHCHHTLLSGLQIIHQFVHIRLWKTLTKNILHRPLACNSCLSLVSGRLLLATPL